MRAPPNNRPESCALPGSDSKTLNALYPHQLRRACRLVRYSLQRPLSITLRRNRREIRVRTYQAGVVGGVVGASVNEPAGELVDACAGVVGGPGAALKFQRLPSTDAGDVRRKIVVLARIALYVETPLVTARQAACRLES